MDQKGTNPAPAEGKPTEAEKELEALRNELLEERTKNKALSRNCILMGMALEKAQANVNGYADGEVLGVVNGRHYHLKALEAAQKHLMEQEKHLKERRRAQEKKAIAAYEKACKSNAKRLGLAFVIGALAVFFGIKGFIHPAIAVLMVIVDLLALGWLLNDFVSLLGGVNHGSTTESR
jgi:hypothetical protein